MDPRLLRFYNDELAYLRESAREFGVEHEAVAGRLGLKTPTDPDPYVERLLEGVAFLGARVQLKLSDQYPEFTQHLLHAIQPHECHNLRGQVPRQLHQHPCILRRSAWTMPGETRGIE